ncbi:MAG: restriction endonuclease subunit S, partial [Akkermansia sp.]
DVGDFVINKMKAWQGSMGVSPYSGIISPAYHVCSITNDEIHKPYFHYLLRNVSYLPEFARLSTGLRIGQWDLSFDDFRNLPFLLPDKTEQERIAAILDAKCAEIDKVVEQTRATIEEYKKLKQAIITEAVTKGVRGPRPMKPSGVEWIGDIPEEWEISTLGKVTLSMRNGYVGPTRDLFVDDGVRYIQSLHIKDGKIDLSKKEYYVRPAWAAERPKVNTGDILIVQTGDIGQVGLVTDEHNECSCHALIIATPDKSTISSEYLTYFLRSTVGRELLLAHKTGALLPHLNSGKIRFAEVVYPGTVGEQQEIVAYLDTRCAEIDRIIGKKEQLIEELGSYKKSLIYEYVTGKKQVLYK